MVIQEGVLYRVCYNGNTREEFYIVYVIMVIQEEFYIEYSYNGNTRGSFI